MRAGDDVIGWVGGYMRGGGALEEGVADRHSSW